MAVVVQEFETIAEPEGRPAPSPGSEAAAPADDLDGVRLERALRQRAMLRLRRWAH